MRLVLVRVSQDAYHFIWTRHHLLLDGWSTSRLISEVLSHYAGQPLPRQQGRYRDYIAWLQRRDENASATYWQNRLKPLEEPTRLTAALKPAGADSGYRHYSQILSADDTARLSAFAQRERVTVNTLVQGAWALLLQCYTGQRVVSFGATSASRPPELPGVETLLGLFINTVPVVMESQPQSAAGPWLRELQSQNLASREHEYTPLFDIQRWAGTGGQALFDSIIVFENYPVDQALRQSVGVDLVFDGSEGKEETNYPLTLSVTLGDRLIVEFSYQGEHFESGQIERLAAHYRAVLMALAEQPERAVGEIELLNEAEKKQLTQWGINSTRYPDVKPVHRLIERQAQIDPTATALIFNDEHLSYADLNVRSNRLAHHLIRLGVKPEVKVGIALERSIEMVVGLLGILKAGGAYVPLDPEYPQERLGYMIGDSGIDLLLTQSRLKGALLLTDTLQVLELDNLDLSAESEHDPQVAVHGENLAYVIYTSGSTGRPKGVTIRHAALSHFLLSMQEKPGITTDDILVAVTSLSFDIAALELYLPLTSGAQIVLASQDEARNGETLAHLIEHSGATLLQCTPAGWRLLLAGSWPGSGNQTFKGLCGGEALPLDLAQELRQIGVSLWNLYGPTETTIWSATGPVSDEVNLGRAIADTQLRVLDTGLNLVPVGVAGELYLGGIGLARGYLNRPDLASERFIADPFGETGERFYRTGDLVRWNTDGQLEYLGRIDHQVKIRGFRIELGEVEAQLLAQPEIREAVAVANESSNGARLVAYVCTAEGEAIDSTLIRERLGQTLLDYMVPSVVVELGKLPLNSNGKVDRKSLPPPGFDKNKANEPPQGEIEKALASIWIEILGLEEVGRNDNFFELGGHSLLALQMVNRIRSSKIFDLPVMLHDVMYRPTIKLLCDTLRPKSASNILIRLNKYIEDANPIFCIHSGWGTSLGYLALARHLDGERTVYCISCRALNNPKDRALTMQEMADDYFDVIRKAQIHGPYNLLGWSLGGALVTMIAARLEEIGETISFLGLVDTYVPALENMTASQADWRIQYPRFLKNISSKMIARWKVPDEVCDPFDLEEPLIQVTAGLLEEKQWCPSSGYEGLSASDIVRLFVANQSVRIARISSIVSLPALRCQAFCWWAHSRFDKERAIKVLSEQLKCAFSHKHLFADHSQIIVSQELLIDVEKLLN